MPTECWTSGAAAPATRHAETAPSVAEAVDLLGALNARAGGRAPCPVDRPLACYGAGALGKLARSHLTAVGVPLSFVVDTDAARLRGDPDWAGVDLLAPDDVPASAKRTTLLAVSVVNSPFAPLRAGLVAAGWEHCIPFYDIAEGFRASHPLSNGWFAAPLDEEQLAVCETVMHGWSDNASRAHHLRFAAWRMAREEWDFADAPVDPASRFFIPEVTSRLTSRERIVDGGAHHGTYLARMLQETDGALARAWAFEPDPANRAILVAWAATLPPATRDRLTIHDTILGAEAGRVRFHEGLGYASQIASTGQRSRDTTSIDSLGLDPSLVKLHLEGAELAALEGARATLRHSRPLVMATVYHNHDGLGRTANWLMRSLDNYRFLMRTHGWCGTGAVIYALPEERHVPS